MTFAVRRQRLDDLTAGYEGAHLLQVVSADPDEMAAGHEPGPDGYAPVDLTGRTVTVRAFTRAGTEVAPSAEVLTQADDRMGVVRVVYSVALLTEARVGDWVLDVYVEAASGNMRRLRERHHFRLESATP